ncbi:MAG: diaminopimelate epimerase [Defluviicoccus sp.]|nr:diaminopimelate epimerase [Defluviicoccus sp.]MDE0275838.1 diaminopimelate epimerase [Defluviicoccus sp.]
MERPAFTKMHGLGNDFVILDARRRGVALGAERVRAIAHRRTGIGCDQLIVLREPADSAADAAFTIHNADGGEVEACGNAARCVAWMAMEESGRDTALLETPAGRLTARRAGPLAVTVDMGEPRFGWRDIPLASAEDTLHLPLSREPLADPAAVSMGNPHAVFFVDHADSVDLAALGPSLEHDPLFPQRANIGVAELRGEERIRLRVWERGAGLTMACGTGACAALVAAHRRGLAGRGATMELDGGPLQIAWGEDNRVTMTGPVAVSFRGKMDGALLG